MKLLGMIFVLISCSGMGLIFSMIYITRINQLKDFEHAMILLKNEINFSLTPLSEALENISRRLNGEISSFFNKIACLLNESSGQRIENIEDQTLFEYLQNTCLNKTDQLKIIEFIKKLGQMDKESQINHIDIHVNNLKHELEIISKDEQKNYKMYKTLGILSGIFIVVLFI